MPILMAAGGAIDYAASLRAKQSLDTMADSAALAAAEFASQEYRNGNSNWNAAGVAAGQKAFNAGVVSSRTDISVGAPTITISLSGQIMTATVSYAAAVRTNLMRIAHIDTMNVANSMTTSVTVAKYTDLHIVIDNSQSMGMAASAADESIIQTALGTTCFPGLPSSDLGHGRILSRGRCDLTHRRHQERRRPVSERAELVDCRRHDSRRGLHVQ
ncbi:MAG: hypothetical protein H6871_04435 [Methylobacteriaceae bacterium]|nr:hypothetical protein [Methylobacteriaceae bacterium]